MEMLLKEINEALAELEKMELNSQARVVVKVLKIICWALGQIKNIPI